MNRIEVLDRIHRDWLVTIFRAQSAVEAGNTFEALIAGGATVVEVALTTPDACRSDRTRFVAGTAIGSSSTPVRSRRLTRSARPLTPAPRPSFHPICIRPWSRLTLKGNAVAIPGCFTPTEFADALRCGADVIKLFPCDMVGPDYLSYIHGPFPGVRIMPVGRITLDNMQSYYDKKAFAGCASTTSLGVLKFIQAGRYDQVTATMQHWIHATKQMCAQEPKT